MEREGAMKITRTQLKEPKMYCEYCEMFVLGKHKKRNLENKQTCLMNRHAEHDTPICELFVLYPFFYCRRNSQQLDITVCIARRGKRRNGCVSCKQGKIINDYVSTKEVFRENNG